jgi:hypothetical protein
MIEEALICEWIGAGYPPRDTITLVHGGARGADSIAESIARRVGMQVECHPAAWDTRGRAAGVIRNSEMVNAGADVCLAFIRNQSRGATHCAEAAERAGIPTRRMTHPTTTERPAAEAVGSEGERDE